MIAYDVKSKRSGRSWILNEDELKKLKQANLSERYTIQKIQPLKTINSPFADRIPEIIQPRTTKRYKKPSE